MIETTALRNALNAYFMAKRQGKAQKAALAVATAVTTLPTQAEVAEFTRRIRMAQGVQDVTMIQDGDYIVHKSGDKGNSVKVNRAEIQRLVADATDVSIDFPAIHSHWGTSIHFTVNGVRHRAFSTDYQLTETYLSM